MLAPLLPKSVRLSPTKMLIDRVVHTSIFEIRQGSCYHNKNDYPQRKDINFTAFVGLSFEHFRCLVLSSAHTRVVKYRFAIMVNLDLSAETKVRNLKLVTRVKQQILRLKISVHDAHLSMHILNGLD